MAAVARRLQGELHGHVAVERELVDELHVGERERARSAQRQRRSRSARDDAAADRRVTSPAARHGRSTAAIVPSQSSAAGRRARRASRAPSATDGPSWTTAPGGTGSPRTRTARAATGRPAAPPRGDRRGPPAPSRPDSRAPHRVASDSSITARSSSSRRAEGTTSPPTVPASCSASCTALTRIGMRAHLDEGVDTLGGQASQRRREEDGVAKVAHPVRRIRARRRPATRAGHRRVERHLGRARGEPVQPGQQIGAQAVDLRAVRGDVDLHAAAEHAARLELAEQLVERAHVAGDHRGTRAVATPRSTAGPRARSEPGARRRATARPSPWRRWPAIPRSRRLRVAMTRAASSRDSAPATWAAATSPMLWPTTASGSTPHARHSAASATWRAKRIGWATSIRSSRDRAASAASSSRSDQSTCGASARSHALQRLGEHRLARQQRPPHAEPLRALPGKHERHPGPGRSSTGATPGPGGTRRVTYARRRSAICGSGWSPPRPAARSWAVRRALAV